MFLPVFFSFIPDLKNDLLLTFLAAKFGVEPALCLDLVRHIVTNCPNLEFCGLMTIGMLDYSSTPENFKVTTMGLPWLFGIFGTAYIFLVILETKFYFNLSRHYPNVELKYVRQSEYRKRNVSYQWAWLQTLSKL